MSPYIFAWILFAGLAAITLWIVARFPELAPHSARGVTASLCVAVIVFVGTPPAIMLVGGVAGSIVAALLVALPGGVCVLLAIAWMMLWVIRSIEPHIH